MSDDQDDWSEKSDLTRIEDLSEYLHEEDPNLDAQLEQADEKGEEQQQEEELYSEPTEIIEDTFASADDFGNDNDNDFAQEEDTLSSHDMTNLVDETLEKTYGNALMPSQEELDSVEDEEIYEESFDHSFPSHTPQEMPPEAPPEVREEPEEPEEQAESEFTSPQEFEPEPVAIEEPAPVPPAQRENFQDLRSFGNAISYSNITTGGNPPFSIILRNIKYKEDAQEILSLLKEYGVVTAETEATTMQGLENGHLLISQISEYSAIFLAHKFRRFDLDLRIGLSEQLHQSRSYESHSRGLVSKTSLKQNYKEEKKLHEQTFKPEDVMILSMSNLNNHVIDQYFDIVTSHQLVSSREIEDSNQREQTLSYDSNMSSLYQNLANQLKSKAYAQGGNAIIGIQYNITPIQSEKTLFKLTCLGNVVWLTKR